MITDSMIMQESIRLVDEGLCVTLPVNGQSMLPFIIGGKESVVLSRPVNIKLGQVVLAWADGNRYVVHRIIRINGQHITLMGDGNLVGTEQCSVDDIKAVVTHVVNAKGQMHPLYTCRRQLAVHLWYWLLPIRRYLLTIYKKLL